MAIPISLHLQTNDLWPIVSGEVECPVGNDDDLNTWIKLDRRARNQILLGIKPSMVSMMLTKKTARDVWTTLKDHYLQSATSNRVFYRGKYNPYSMVSGHSISDHLRALIELECQLDGLGDPVGDDDKLIVLFESLPETYDLVVRSMRYHPNVTYQDVVTALMQEELHTLRRKSTPDSEGALLASSNRFANHTCNNCGKKGHIARQCRKAPRGEAGSTSNSTIPPTPAGQAPLGASNFNHSCYNCGEKRHKKSECTKEPKPAVGAISEVIEVSEVEIDGGSKRFYAMAVEKHAEVQSWLIDSGASRHMCHNQSLFKGPLLLLKTPIGVRVGNGSLLQATHVGKIGVNVRCESQVSMVELNDVLFVPNLHFNLFSISSCTRFGHSVTFVKDTVIMTTLDGVRFCEGHHVDDLWYLTEWTAQIDSISPEIAMVSHASSDSIVDGIPLFKSTIEIDPCHGSSTGKISATAKSLRTSIESSSVLDLIHYDVCEFVGPLSWGGANYFCTFIDDHSRLCSTYVIETKDQALDCFVKFVAMAETATGKQVKSLRSNRGGEYTLHKFDTFLESRGIRQTYG